MVICSEYILFLEKKNANSANMSSSKVYEFNAKGKNNVFMKLQTIKWLLSQSRNRNHETLTEKITVGVELGVTVTLGIKEQEERPVQFLDICLGYTETDNSSCPLILHSHLSKGSGNTKLNFLSSGSSESQPEIKTPWDKQL